MTVSATRVIPSSPLGSALFSPLQFEKGVGPQKAEILAGLNLKTVGDLLLYFPRDHQDRRIIPIKDISTNQKKAIKGEILSIHFDRVGKMLGQARALVRVDGKTITAL
jgi:ATP-dependent DNA helicase RecG